MSRKKNMPNGLKSLKEMLPVERLVWLNRWAKVKDFYREDADLLFATKDAKIIEMIKSGAMVATKVVARPEPTVIQGMRTAIANKGVDLTLLNSDCSVADILDGEELQHFDLLQAMADPDMGFNLDYPEEVYQLMIAPFKAEIEAYEKAKQEADAEAEKQKPVMKQYNRDCTAWHKAKIEAASAWAREYKGKIKFVNINKPITKKSLQLLEKQGFKFDVPRPVKPLTVTFPTAPKLPSKQYSVDFETYVPGSIQQVEEAIAWARELCEVPNDYADINDDFVCFDLEPAIRDRYLENQVECALSIFQQVLSGELKDPKEIWDLLTALDLDYDETLGMRCFTDYRNYENRHADYNTWHNINLSVTGYWLIEFQSQEIPEIVFHVPYDRVATWDEVIDIDSLPKVEDESQMGREISEQEKIIYPLSELLPYFGLSTSDFPRRLEIRVGDFSSRYSARDCYTDEDDFDEYDDFDNDYLDKSYCFDISSW
ncbi:hypothetical protein Cri9333_0622 [Crinalium epipsammum PCC 9333]|uniref:Uncharacterized protein n=1 Tax=Crinalium epipsammum PCC 9333 TaxID=1173022 RepID=K9VWQ1_9CYAN|nr:hypothetical protein [Crinalium epipsammum]AFZ11565.1 hypothetical protein Cri9333_0622 [Crinalium epipsammum PCC 9333]